MFSVIIPTRNRPALFRKALESVLAQTCTSLEIIVVDDGSADEHHASYREIVAAAGRPVSLYSLVQRPRGHGPGYVRNFGVNRATATYLCFLDDDDSWIDHEYLERVRTSLAGRREPTDLHLSNQIAFLSDRQKPGPIWIEELTDILAGAGKPIDEYGEYPASVDDLLRCGGFCHLNTLIVRRRLYQEMGGMDEGIGWEQDRDIYFRLLDRAKSIRYSPRTVARHNIPDPGKRDNSTTSFSELEKKLFQLRVCDKMILFASHPGIRATGLRHKGYTLKEIARFLASTGRYATAFRYAREAWGVAPTLKWTGYTGWIGLLRLVDRPASSTKGDAVAEVPP